MKIALSALLALLLIGCSSDTSTEQTQEKVVKEEKSSLNQAAGDTKSIEIPSGEEIQKSVSQGLEKASEAVNAVAASISKKVEESQSENTEQSMLDKVVEDVKSIEVPSSEEVKASMSKSVDTVSKAIQSTTSNVVATVADSMPASVNGKALYAKCAGCHGSNGEKKALGKSAIIQAWASEKTVNVLNGYKDGSYGGAMKSLMKGQVTKLSDDEIKAIADYIAGL